MTKNNKKTGKSRLALTQSDLDKLKATLEAAKTSLANRVYIGLLDEKLEEAEVVPAEQVPVDQVEINRRVVLTDLDREQKVAYTLVLPRAAKYGSDVSVLTPLGSALLGSRLGEIVEIHAPARTRRVRIDEISEIRTSSAA